MLKIDTYKVFVLQGYELITANGDLFNAAVFEVMAENVTEALKIAKAIAKEAGEEKKFWRLNKFIELPLKK